jgi:hypothetical protein
VARSRWLPVAVSVLSAALLAYAIYVSLARPTAILAVPTSALAIGVSRRRPEVAALLALVSLALVAPPVVDLSKLGPIAPLPKGGSP